MFDRRQFLASMISASVAWPMAARAQAVRKVARIGVVSIGGPSGEMTGPLPSNRNVRASLRGMAELGYVYGREFVTEPSWQFGRVEGERTSFILRVRPAP